MVAVESTFKIDPAKPMFPISVVAENIGGQAIDKCI